MIRQTIFWTHLDNGGAARTTIVRFIYGESNRKIVCKSQARIALRFAIIAVLALLAPTPASAGDHAKWTRLMEEANKYAELGAFDNAESAFRSALREAESPRRASLDCAATLNNLGGLFLGRGKVLEAEKFLLRAWVELENTPGSVKEFQIRVAAALTSLWIETGKDLKAEALIQRLLATNELPADTDSAALLGNLGVVLAHRHMFEMARTRLQMTIQGLAEAADSRAFEVRAVALSNLAGIELAQTGDLDRAGGYYQQALAIMNGLSNPAPGQLAMIMAGYAGLLLTSGRLQESEDLYRKAIGLTETRLGTDNELFGTLLQGLSSVVIRQGRKSEANQLKRRSKKILARVRYDNMLGYTIDATALTSGMSPAQRGR